MALRRGARGGLGGQARELHGDVRQRRQPGEVRGPRCFGAGPGDGGLAQVVEHERHPGAQLDEPGHLGELPGAHAEVADQVGVRQQTGALDEPRAQREARGLVLHQAPDPDDEGLGGQLLELGPEGLAALEPERGHHPERARVRAREVEQPGGLGIRLVGAAVGLDEHAARQRHAGPEVGGHDPADQPRVRGQPGVREPAGVPGVHVGVDHRRHPAIQLLPLLAETGQPRQT